MGGESLNSTVPAGSMKDLLVKISTTCTIHALKVKRITSNSSTHGPANPIHFERSGSGEVWARNGDNDSLTSISD